MSNRRSLIGEAAIMMGVDNVPEPIIDINNYLTMVALEDGLTAKLSVNECEYCIDGDGNWKTLTAATNTEAINTGQTLSFRGNLTPVSDEGIGTFILSKFCNLEGNCMSMLFGDEAADNTSLEGKDYAFCDLFRHCSNIKSVSEGFLPATTLADYCYQSMFYSCSSLTTAPSLPAMTLTSSCYEYMFSGCKKITQVPELPATTLADSCYYGMFAGCESLTQTPALPATTLADWCYQSMFYNCKGLTQAPELPATTLANGCYYDMFTYCSSLTQAPELPATTLTSFCYQNMFKYCTSLTTAPSILPATKLVYYCYADMFSGCTSLTQAPALSAKTLDSFCCDDMFSGCTNLTQAPELLATSLVTHCYRCMFYGCSKLNHIKAMFTTTPSTSYTLGWVTGVASTGTFVKNKRASWSVTGTYAIPEGWTVETA